MALGLRIMILFLCISFLITFRADAQQVSPNDNSHMARIHHLSQEMQRLRQQLEPLRLQIQQLMSQVKTVKEQMSDIQEKLTIDGGQLRALHEEHGQ